MASGWLRAVGRLQSTRLAQLLLLMANFGKKSYPEPTIAKISHETLAQLIGTTRARVSIS